jgi:hypothetical protein
MQVKEFKSNFNYIAEQKGFVLLLNSLFKESEETIVSLDLQKSNYGNSYYLNIKIFIKGFFSNNNLQKENLEKMTGDIFRREPKSFSDIFDLDSSMADEMKKDKLLNLFETFILPFCEKASSIKGIKELEEKGEILILPKIKEFIK